MSRMFSRSNSARMILGLGVAVLLLAAPLAAQRNARMLHRNLDELVGDSYTIVAGRVLSVRAEVHPQYNSIHTIVVTLQVSEVLKGQSGSQFTFQSFVDDAMDIRTNLDYKVGQELLLMMTQPSSIGLSSPAGLEQGRFRVQSDAQGNRFLVNGYNNMGLFRNLATTSPALHARLTSAQTQLVNNHSRGPIAYDQLRDLIRTSIAARSSGTP